MHRIYIDTSAIKRPFDDQSQPRIWLETAALTLVLQMVESGDAEMAASSIHEFENERNPIESRRAWMSYCIGKAVERVRLDSATIARASSFEDKGLKALDACHLACAEAAGCDFFVTCDDGILGKRDLGCRPRVVGPEELIRILGRSLA